MAGEQDISADPLRGIAAQVGEEFRKSLARIKDPEPVPYEGAQVDALYDLLRRGVIEVGPGAFA